jgi:hypothetical protein
MITPTRRSRERRSFRPLIALITQIEVLMKNLTGVRVAVLLALAASVAGQSSAKLPCDYSGKLLRKDTGEIVRLQSDEMKQRATHKADIGDFMRRTDFRDDHVIEVLVGPSGNVLCAKTVSGLPVASVEVEKAVSAWTFQPAKKNGESVAYVGFLEFFLCNTSCGERGFSMSIVK